MCNYNQYRKTLLIILFFLGARTAQAADAVHGPIDKDTWQNLFTARSTDSSAGFDVFINRYIGIMIGLAGIAATYYLIYYAFLMITAQGKEEQFTKAKTGLLWAIVGIIFVVLSAFIAIAARNLALGLV